MNKESTLRLSKKTDEAGRTALFYGFLPIEPPPITREDLDLVRGLDEEWHPAEKAAVLREFSLLKDNLFTQPLMLFYKRKKTSKIECELVILGSQKSVCEAILIQATRAILENAGWRETSMRLNSVGSKENIIEFERKMLAFVRKRMADFPAELRQGLKRDLYCLLKSRDQKYKEWLELAPQSVDYLSEASRLHLKEILEFLETIEFPYLMDSSLIGDIKYSTEAVFEIVSDRRAGEQVLARGLRWNRLSKKIGLKREIPAVSVNIRATALRMQKNVTIKIAKPKFYLIQFGPEAKKTCFLVLEKLRKAGIPVAHSLVKDKLTGQISSVEQGEVPYIILIGQKEAIDNMAVIRNTVSRAQYTVPIAELAEFIKKSDEFK